MKRLLLLLFFILSIKAYSQDTTLQINESIKFVSSYLYHGNHYGGFSIQPNVEISYNGVFTDIWFNIGAKTYKQKKSTQEMDLLIGYSVKKNYKV